MKRFALFFWFSVLGIGIYVLEARIPEFVKQQFTQLYPQAESLIWEQEADGYTATFQSHFGLKKVLFDVQGEWLESELKLDKTRMPVPVLRYIKEKHRGADFTFFGRAYDRNAAWYRVESEYDDRIVLKNLDVEGRLLNEEIIQRSASIPNI